MLPASNRGAGSNLGFPDVCLTPAGPAVVPIPYPNIAMNAQAAPFSPVVKVSMMNALNMGSKIPMTSGDEAGTAHPTIKGMGAYTMGNPIVFIDKLPAINLTCPTTGNNMNNPIGAVLVPSAVNVFYTYNSSPGAPSSAESYDRALNDRELAALGEVMAASPPVAPGEVLPGDIGYLRIAVFTPDLPRQIFNQIGRLEAGRARALVLDLRGNPGGSMDAAIELAGDFLAPGSVIAVVHEGDGDEVVRRGGQDTPYSLPLVLLIDRDTASAAELFAGSLQAQSRAVLVGETSHGKGLAQAVLPALDGNGVVCATIASFTLPGGAAVQGAGIEPDLAVSASDPAAALQAAWQCAVALLTPS
jgi:carboxyl-terminal processing protease